MKKTRIIIGALILLSGATLSLWFLMANKSLDSNAGANVQNSRETATASSLQIYVSLPPLAYLTQLIGGDKIEVSALMTPADDPHIFEPRPHLLRQLATTDLLLVFGSGVEFETAGLARIQASQPTLVVHSICPTPPLLVNLQESGKPDPHVWLSITNIKYMLSNIAALLGDQDPVNQAYYQNNLKKALALAEQTAIQLRELTREHHGRTLITLHDGWRYTARELGLEIITIQEHHGDLAARELARIIDAFQTRSIVGVIVMPQGQGAISNIANLLAKVADPPLIVANPLSPDTLKLLLETAQQFKNTK